MAMMDVFKADAFSMMSMLAALDNIDYNPQFLGSLDLFQDEPLRVRVASIESRENTLALIKTSEIGAPPEQRGQDKRKVRNFNTFRIAKGSRIEADAIQGIRAFGSETELQQVQDEVARRLTQLQADVELTWEHMRLGAVKGLLVDADGSTLYNYFTEFGIAAPAVVDFNFHTLAAGQVRPLIEAGIVRPLIRAAKGAFTSASRIQAICGDDFWDEFINHAEIRQTFLNWTAAAALREGTAFSSFRYAGVDWQNYRGTDDNSTVAVAHNEARFFPVNAGNTFQVAWAPGEFIPVANQPGVPLRPLMLLDPSGREAFVDIEMYSYPLYICTRPLTLRSAELTS